MGRTGTVTLRNEMTVELNDTETEILRVVLDATLRDLRMEIADTDSPRYRRGLRVNESSIRNVLDRLGGPLPNPV